ncbi:hypothetical protein A8C32_02620 [Flavivirga aquatica]|uniref:Uncharacterized protein n=1 Tax=Flavivirga aquatica TaxID=1849968 RepID=A0A1E5TAF8_9FLAO|nr:hypothetical protein [Flavivirga aquatica]OEK08363.1 hypothetical protein A8C32_02620 [Flavivirga aquatica]
MESMIYYTSVKGLSNCNLVGFKQGIAKESDVFILDALKKTHHAFFKRRCSVNEQIELLLVFSRNKNDSVSIKDSAKLHENLSINSVALECPKSDTINILKNETKEVVFRIYTTDEDYLDITLIVTNNNFRYSKCITSIQNGLYTKKDVTKSIYVYKIPVYYKLVSGF